MKAKWIAGLAGAGLAAFAVWAARQPMVNDVTTGQTPEYPDLQPRQYSQAPPVVFRAVQTVAESTRGWRVTVSDPTKGTLTADAHVLLTPFTDDVTLRIEPVDGGSRVVMRSRSRVGRGDLGVNARRIRAFFRALDRELRTLHPAQSGVIHHGE